VRATELGVASSVFKCMKVPQEMVGMTYGDAYARLAMEEGIILIGLLRQPTIDWGNKVCCFISMYLMMYSCVILKASFLDVQSAAISNCGEA